MIKIMSENKNNVAPFKPNCHGLTMVIELIASENGNVQYIVRSPKGDPVQLCNSLGEVVEFGNSLLAASVSASSAPGANVEDLNS